MKKALSFLLVFCMLLPLFCVPAYAANTALTGTWGDQEPIHNGLSTPFYLDKNVVNCKDLTLELSIYEFTGHPFGNWYVYAKDLKGNWSSIADFKLSKDMDDGHTETYTFRLKQPKSFQALALCMRDKGNSYSLSWGKANFSIGSGSLQSNARPTPKPVAQRGTLLTGSWGDQEPIHNGTYSPFVLSKKVTGCTDLTMALEITDYTGYPFGNWYLYAKDLEGNWSHIAEFRIEKDQGDGSCTTYDFHFKKPQSFKALAICVRDKGSQFSLSWDIDFYV